MTKLKSNIAGLLFLSILAVVANGYFLFMSPNVAQLILQFVLLIIMFVLILVINNLD